MATADCFLKLDGIQGESTDDKHGGEIELINWSWGASNTADMGSFSGGGGVARVSMNDLSFTTHTSTASPNLMLACATGQAIKTAIITCRKAGQDQQEYYIITLNDVLVTSYHVSGSGGTEVPIESASLAFGKIAMQYKGQKADGTLGSQVKTGFDLTANKKL